MTWRDGVHLTDTPIWCDARRRRDVCFVSAVDRVLSTGHGQLIATPTTLALLGADPHDGHLGAPLRRRFTLGTLRLELIDSGHGLGTAALFVDLAGRRVLAAGAIRTIAVPEFAITAAETRECDAVVVDASLPARGAPLADVIASVVEWSRDMLETGRIPVLLVDGVLAGLEVARCLQVADLAVAGSRSICELGRRGGVTIALASKRPRVLVWPTHDRDKAIATTRRLGQRSVLAQLGSRGVPADEVAFPWTATATTSELVHWIEATTAREVYVTGPDADAIVHQLGPRARRLGPPEQMVLFEAS